MVAALVIGVALVAGGIGYWIGNSSQQRHSASVTAEPDESHNGSSGHDGTDPDDQGPFQHGSDDTHDQSSGNDSPPLLPPLPFR